MRGLKIVAAAMAVLLLAACGTIRLDQIVTGTKCSTRETCLKDLNLPNPTNPKYTFLVDPYVMDEKARTPIGLPVWSGSTFYANADICVAKALRNEFGKNARIVFSKENLEGKYTEIKINDVVFHETFLGDHMWIKYRLTTSGKIYSFRAETPKEVFSHLLITGEAKDEYPEACAILAKQVKTVLQKEATAQTTVWKAGN